MNAVGIIAKKRDGNALSRKELEFFVNSYLRGDIKDYQMSALLMAVYLRGMDLEEIGWLTDVMLNSGEVIMFPEPNQVYVDKHSTGGIGDKVSLILAPLVASCGVKVPMLSGRGLGHTGGTLDKLEAIPGYRTDLTMGEFRDGVEKIGCIITGQTLEMAPADRMMYALRDVTATVESIPLICSSILSKKLAAGPSGLVFDIKCGNGAFMKDMEVARKLAETLIEVGKAMGKNVRALITDMNQPLGYAVGNLLEVVEAVEFLRGEHIPDLFELIIELGVEMLLIAGIESDRVEASNLLRARLEDKVALEKFEEMVEFQGGDLSIIKDPSRRPKAAITVCYCASEDGYLQEFSTAEIGFLIIEMGGGRKTKDTIIDPLVGLKFLKKIGQEVTFGENLVEIYAQNQGQAEMVSKSLNDLIKIGQDEPEIPELIKGRIS